MGRAGKIQEDRREPETGDLSRGREFHGAEGAVRAAQGCGCIQHSSAQHSHEPGQGSGGH